MSSYLSYVLYVDISEDIAKQEEGLTQQITAASIAVMPFRDQSPDQDQAYLAEGLAEELTSLLGKDKWTARCRYKLNFHSGGKRHDANGHRKASGRRHGANGERQGSGQSFKAANRAN